jgi:hypothetical protein
MSAQAPAWFKEIIKDKVTIGLQAHGGLLDNTMMTGDTQAGTVKFPIVTGQSTVYKLTGAIEDVPVSNPGLTTVTLTLDDYEAAEWWRTQDAYKSGASEQDALAKILQKAIRRKRDTIKLDALSAFYTLDGGINITTTGTGAEVPDVLHFEKAAAELKAYGQDDDDQIFVIVPELWMSQLSLYKEYANSQWVGPENTPFSKTQRLKMRTIRDINYIVAPDIYFSSPAGQPTQLISWMWMKSSMGAETPYNLETATLSQHEEKQGSPWLAKAALSGAAIGIQAKGIKRFLLSKITSVVRGP